jgi:hypothetical protein
VGEAKTDAGRRDIRLRPVLRDVLASLNAGASDTRAKALVFPMASGKAPSASHVRNRILAPAVRRANEALAEELARGRGATRRSGAVLRPPARRATVDPGAVIDAQQPLRCSTRRRRTYGGRGRTRSASSAKVKNTGAASVSWRGLRSWPWASSPARWPTMPPAGDSIATSTRWPSIPCRADRTSGKQTCPRRRRARSPLAGFGRARLRRSRRSGRPPRGSRGRWCRARKLRT